MHMEELPVFILKSLPSTSGVSHRSRFVVEKAT
jgi:hypothetical protein